MGARPLTDTRLRIVYVVGSSHSGSTLLALLGTQHPQMASVGEASIKRRIRREGRAASQRCSCGRGLGSCPFWQALFRRVNAEGLRFDAAHWSNDYRFEHPLLDRVLTRETSVMPLRQLRRWAARHLPLYQRRFRHIDAVNVAFVRAVLAETSATVFLDTTKLPTRLAHLLDNAALDVRVVWLTRDVRGVAYSAKRRGLAVDVATSVWRHDQEAVRSLLATMSPDRTLRLRYEDVCAFPGRTLASLWTFSGLAPVALPRTVTPADHHVLGNSMRIADQLDVRLDEAWRTGLTDEEQQRILLGAGPVTEILGYD